MGPIETLTEEEKKAYYEIKNRTQDDAHPDVKDDYYMYLRFLRARDFNLTLAENMLKTHLAWRKSNQIDEKSFKDFVPNKVISKYLPISTVGIDKEGYPINYVDFGNMDIKGLIKSYKKRDVVKTCVKKFEEDVITMKQQTKKLGKPIEQWIYIIDYNNYSLAKATHKQTLEVLISIFMTYEANYPERLKTAYLINASYYFSLLFAVIKPLLSGATLRKLQIYGKDGWKEPLLKAIDAEVLPAFLGGKRTDPDGNPMCHTVLIHGAPVPEEYYVTRSTTRLSDQPGVKKLNVSRMSKSQLKMLVTEPDSMLEWEFETESRDIAFSVIFKDKPDSPPKEVIPKERIDAHLTSEVGMFKCDKPGTYILVFDNSYSWIHQKEIYCRVAVVTPKGHRITLND